MSQPQPFLYDWRMLNFTSFSLSPPFCHAIKTEHTSVCISYAEDMNIEETAAWVRTLGYYKGWKQWEIYATNFRKNAISGKLLQDLNREMLEDSLGISDDTHKDEFISEIKSFLRKPSMSVINRDSEKFCAYGSAPFNGVVDSAQGLSSEFRNIISDSTNQSDKLVGLPFCGNCDASNKILSSISGGKSECGSNTLTYFSRTVGEQSGCAKVNSFSGHTTSGSDIDNTGEIESSDTTTWSFPASSLDSYFNSVSSRRN